MAITKAEVLKLAHEATDKWNELLAVSGRPLEGLPYEDLVALKRQKKIAELAYHEARGRYQALRDLYNEESAAGPQGPTSG